jgi:hypothetical protein
VIITVLGQKTKSDRQVGETAYTGNIMRLSLLNEKTKLSEPIWHITVALLVAIGLQLLLNAKLVFGSKYAVAGLEGLLVIVLLYPGLASAVKRAFALLLIGILALANVVSLGLVIDALVFKSGEIAGRQLLISSVAIYLTNIILFGILFWELDGTRSDEADFGFPQFSDPAKKSWQPTFFDYLYVSITNATAFSPTDTMPLTHRAKSLMTLQSLTALVTVALVAARAVNILN